MRRSEQFGEAQALAEALRRNADLLDSKITMEALAEIAGMLNKNGIDPKQLLGGLELDPELMKNLQQQKLDPEQLKKLVGARTNCPGGWRNYTRPGLSTRKRWRAVAIQASAISKVCGRS